MDFLLTLVATFIAWLAITHCFLPLVRFINLQVTLLKIPAPERPHWLLGHLPLYMVEGNEEDRYERWLKDPRTKLMRVHIPFIHVNLVHPETASEVFKTAEPKDEAYEFLRPWLGDGLLLSTGKRWARDRRLLTRGFHFDILRGYFPVYKEAVGIMLDQWAELGRQDDPQTINVSKCSKLLALDVILRCIMSFESHCQTEGADKNILEYVEAVFGMSQCINQRYCSPLQYPGLLFALSSNGRKFYHYRAISHGVSRRVMAERRKTLAEERDVGGEEGEKLLKKKISRKYLDFLDILLTVRDETGKGLSDKEIQEQVDTFLFEGHDTTASALQWTLYYLAAHPDLQENCRQEVQSCLDENKELSFENLNHLSYLTQFIKESMRLSSPVPFVGRTLTQPLTLDGYRLPAGTNITMTIFGMHRHPDVWERPLVFDPDRFSLENSAKRHPYAFVPFAAGPRNCIGQSLAMDELKTVISHVLLRFRLTVDADYVKPKIYALLVSHALGDIKLHVHEI